MEEVKSKDNAGVKLPPPLVFLSITLVGFLIEYLSPLSMGVSSTYQFLGILLIFICFVSIVMISKIFKKRETAIKPWESTTNIISTGPYKYSRNPIYVLLCGLPIGLGIYFNSYWVLFAFIPALLLVYLSAVKREEKYLESKFGQEYLAYKGKVRRWL
jgi:protein-S-isoprenylcysteine O-methyltransferase Ste14